MDSLSPQQAYQPAKIRFGFVTDSSQQRAVQVLETCFRTLHTASNPPGIGVYLWGPVGRGKTWLMNNFHHGWKVPARRLHFHRFMQWPHRRLFELTGTADHLLVTAAELAWEVRVPCFDDLFVSDNDIYSRCSCFRSHTTRRYNQVHKPN
ncbi:AFG1/ZapE family ATPase [Haliea sp. E1-2-M8]|uniref:AFG1/ZapE family ATPase n=1 Tax=Haliea sp. E1-2-M8 TaxID=3064706 RepID=UPI00271ACBBC|nr:AFG1/ZapE family ATPase [Haliea sp. E1-2-M8]MDO8863692.1 AFG1/ZapE family ATPase [Haliea sp. E1-2-M8]